MDESFQEVGYAEPEPKRGLTGWQIALIIVAALIVICCVCLLVSLLLFPVVLGPEIGDVFSTIIETMEAMTPMP
jgi:hypothetical protein